jgi:hypothetical protein
MEKKLNESPEIALQMLKSNDAPLIQYLQGVSITNEDQRKNCEANLILASRAYTKADEVRKSILAPLNEAIAKINALFRPYLKQFEDGIHDARQELSDYRIRDQQLQNENLNTVAKEYITQLQIAKETGRSFHHLYCQI